MVASSLAPAAREERLLEPKLNDVLAVSNIDHPHPTKKMVWVVDIRKLAGTKTINNTSRAAGVNSTFWGTGATAR